MFKTLQKGTATGRIREKTYQEAIGRGETQQEAEQLARAAVKKRHASGGAVGGGVAGSGGGGGGGG
jgi:hypothetical protein